MLIKSAALTPDILQIVQHKGTERPFTGEYDLWDKPGTFLCRQCGSALFRSYRKFNSGCGWPSFDEEIPSAIIQQQDADGQRTEILCAHCNAHLGHVFHGENYTAKNIRHCVNSLSIEYVNDLTIKTSEEGFFAAGCFWGVEYFFKKLAGVLKAESGYMGGHKSYPSYQDICKGNTGHLETVRVLYDPQKLTYESLAKYFFEIHDPAQVDGQGPDRGEQYLSAVFYYNNIQKNIAEDLIQRLNIIEKPRNIATKVLPVSTFWPAEAYHQDYYQKNGQAPYCHQYTQKF